MSYPQRRYEDPRYQIRANNRIRAREVRVIDGDGNMLGIMSIQNALQTARDHDVDLVEISPKAVPPVCKLVDIGKYLYDAAKREKETKKKQHANKVKEVQVRPVISDRDFQVKLERAVGFFCGDMKVKLVLRFRGREMQHKEFGFETVNRFIEKAAPWATADSAPKVMGRGIAVMMSPLPRNKRAKNPKGEVSVEQLEQAELEDQRKLDEQINEAAPEEVVAPKPKQVVKEEARSVVSSDPNKPAPFGAPVLDVTDLKLPGGDE